MTLRSSTLARCPLPVLVLLALGCATNATAPAPSPIVITTNATQYSLGGSLGGGVAFVVVTVENQDEKTLYTPPRPCGFYIQVKSSDGSWSYPHGSPCEVNVGLTPFAPGAQWTDTVFVSRAGTFRMVLDYGADSAQATNKQSASNTFVVTQ